MQCQKCNAVITDDEAFEFAGRILCEDCYMDALSPARTCDPWATYLGSRQIDQILSPGQEKILALLREHKAISPEDLPRLSGLGAQELQREIAALRHMEKIRGALTPDGRKVFKQFDDRD